MSNRRSWSKKISLPIKRNMEETAHAAYRNGCDTWEDAMLLFAAKRYPRATALAILSEEEFSKAFILRVCALEGRWDSNIYLSLRKHSNKQGIAEGMRDHFYWFIENYGRVIEMNRGSVVQHEPATIPSREWLDKLRSKVTGIFTHSVRDVLKQDAFYVSVDVEAKLKSVPASIGKEQAKQCLDEAEKFKVVVEVLSGDTSGLEKWVQF